MKLMAYRVFISYSTKDLWIADHVKAALTLPGVEVFIAEYNVPPSAPLNLQIELAIRACDLFVLLWSRNSKSSDYVPQEIGIARGCGRAILPVVLEDGLTVPGFISELKYLPAFRNPVQSVAWLQQFVWQNATSQQQGTAALVVMSLLGLLCLMSDDRR